MRNKKQQPLDLLDNWSFIPAEKKKKAIICLIDNDIPSGNAEDVLQGLGLFLLKHNCIFLDKNDAAATSASISKQQILDAESYLTKHGIDSEDAGTVLQALGYILMDRELYPAEGHSPSVQKNIQAKNKEIKQISVDVLVGKGTDGDRLAEEISEELESLGYIILGSGFQGNITAYYTEDDIQSKSPTAVSFTTETGLPVQETKIILLEFETPENTDSEAFVEKVRRSLNGKGYNPQSITVVSTIPLTLKVEVYDWIKGRVLAEDMKHDLADFGLSVTKATFNGAVPF